MSKMGTSRSGVRLPLCTKKSPRLFPFPKHSLGYGLTHKTTGHYVWVGVGVRGFSWPVWEILFLNTMLWGVFFLILCLHATCKTWFLNRAIFSFCCFQKLRFYLCPDHKKLQIFCREYVETLMLSCLLLSTSKRKLANGIIFTSLNYFFMSNKEQIK